MSTFLSMTLGGGLMALLYCALSPVARKYLRSREMLLLCLLCMLRFLLPLPGLIQRESPRLTLRASIERAEAVVTPAPEPVATIEQTMPIPEKEKPSFDLRQTLPLLWAVGVATVLTVELGGYLRFRRKLLLTAKRCTEEERGLLRALHPGEEIGMVRSPLCAVPMLLGPLHALVVLPADMDAKELPNILRHELCHRQLGHLYMKWAALFVCALHWFNPAIWLLRRSLEQLCELHCDETVIEGMSVGEKQSYGETLIRLSAAKAPRVLSTAATGSGKEHMKQRLVQIMGGHKSRERSLCLGLLCALLLAGCGSVVGREIETVGDTMVWTEDGNYYTTDGNVWYASNGNAAFYTYATDGNSHRESVVYATDGNLYPNGMETVSVSSAAELLEAMTNYNHLLLRPGTYDLRDKALGIRAYSYWKPDDRGHALHTENGFDLGLSAEGDVTILCDRWSWDAVNSYNVKGIRFRGELTLYGNISGYFEDCDFSEGSVTLDQCYAVTFRGCRFDGVPFVSHFTQSLSIEDCAFSACDRLLFNICDNARLLRCTVDGHAVEQTDMEIWGMKPEMK